MWRYPYFFRRSSCGGRYFWVDQAWRRKGRYGVADFRFSASYRFPTVASGVSVRVSCPLCFVGYAGKTIPSVPGTVVRAVGGVWGHHLACFHAFLCPHAERSVGAVVRSLPIFSLCSFRWTLLRSVFDACPCRSYAESTVTEAVCGAGRPVYRRR